ncbi:hypothetical protein EV421DRAFT_1827513 [Armillaria borealis]|uniref:Uncharacterized protein n=1 Tax=Armillaria borealis TaxID=47425 RepID=A0AA39J7M6_9AGAR|nr:hypothetical protein EV421DRAFT_1827513 [Armillaria borealis]
MGYKILFSEYPQHPTTKLPRKFYYLFISHQVLPLSSETLWKYGALGYLFVRSSVLQRHSPGVRCFPGAREYLHPKVLEGFWGYLTGLSEAMKKTGNQSPDPETFPGWHIQDLHRAVVIRCICASIVHSGTQPRPILSFLASIVPHHPEWSRILDTLNSPDDKYSIEKYNFHWYPSPDDKECLKKDMKDVVRILDECLKAARGSNNDINQVCS